MSFDLRILEDWKQVVAIEEDEMTPVGPFPQWRCVVHHPVELRKYHVDIKQLETHWRMRVFYKSIREGHRFMKALFPYNLKDLEEVKFLAIKHLKRYFEEQLALYNAICIIHMGRKYTEVCECHESDHSQHLAEEQQPLLPYDGIAFRRGEHIAKNKEGKDLCKQCLGDMDIEAYLKFNLCPWCQTPLPETEEEYKELLEKSKEDYHEEWMHARKGVRAPLIDS